MSTVSHCVTHVHRGGDDKDGNRAARADLAPHPGRPWRAVDAAAVGGGDYYTVETFGPKGRSMSSCSNATSLSRE